MTIDRRRRRRLARAAVPFLICLAIASASIVGAWTADAPAPRVGGDVRRVFRRDVDSLDHAFADLLAALAPSTPRSARLRDGRVRAAFRRAREKYKHVEPLLEFYSPALAAALNSRRQEVDDDDQPPPSTLAASGFPALERALWPAIATDSLEAARKTVEGMRATIVRMRWLDGAIAVTDPQLIEVARLELVRISTLGIAGFDAPATGAALIESADALDGLRTLFAAAGADRWPRLAPERRTLDDRLATAASYLRSHADYENSDRLTILVDHLLPAAGALQDLRTAAHIEPLTMPRPLRADAPSPYAAQAFDARAYAPSGTPRSSAELRTLGARLFAEPRLSRDGSRSCASCHQPGRAFADGMVVARSVDSRGARVTRNTPTVLNVGLQPTQFADERAASLEDQVSDVLASVAEMGSSADHAAEVVARDSSYQMEFGRAFRVAPEGAVTPLRLRQAIASYLRSLGALDSRFDRAVHGDAGALSAEERHGFTLFMGKAGCGTCHFAPLFSGDTPPLYRASDVEVIGTPRSSSRLAAPDADSGRARVDHLPAHLRAFKTPSLRNVALTAPYMHNGVFRTLDDVVDFYDGGGASGRGAAISNQTLAPDSLHLTVAERHALVSFMRALTDSSYEKR